jgi:capsular polysaccharide biosynthesis protein
MHVFNNRMVERLLWRFGQPEGLVVKRLFLTRSFFRNPAMVDIGFENEHAVAQMAAQDFGFCPIAPETLPWPDQIRLFAGARVIAGRFGSALHNTIFCHPGARVGVIRFGNLIQSSISALRCQQLAYTVEGSDQTPFAANLDHVRRILATLVNDAEKEESGNPRE